MRINDEIQIKNQERERGGIENWSEVKSGQLFERLLTKRQLADLLGISVSYIDKLMPLGEVPYLKIGKAVRFRQTEVLAWLQRRSKP